MSVVTGIAAYFVIWWIVLFAVLPWGVKIPDNPEPGHATSAPERPQLGRKALWTTAISAVIWLGFFLVNYYDLISFRRWIE
jgi:predicted secreted protein